MQSIGEEKDEAQAGVLGGEGNGKRPPEIDVMMALVSGVFPSWVNEHTTAEVVDPATKERLMVPLANMENTNGLRTYFLNRDNPKRRESYLCMLYQKTRCKSHARCNQIHADREFVKVKREEKNGGADVEPYSDQRSNEVIVQDPSNPSSRVVIPYTKTIDTLGRIKYLESQQSTSPPLQELPMYQLCPGIVNSKGCSSPGGPSQCPHIHAQTDFLQFLKRPRACCKLHGDQVPDFPFKGRIFMVNRHTQRCPLPVERITHTRGLKELLPPTSMLLVFNANRVCRMFLEGKCPFGAQCANLHVCREFYAFYVNASNPSLVSLGMPSMPGTPGNFKKPPEQEQYAPLNVGSVGMGGMNSMGGMGAMPGMGGMGMNIGATLPGMPHMGMQLFETFGIPLATEEGPVPLDVLPPQARCRALNIPPGAAPASNPFFYGVGGEGAKDMNQGAEPTDTDSSPASPTSIDANGRGAEPHLSSDAGAWLPSRNAPPDNVGFTDSFAEQYV